jgi:hypothetical protein
LSDRSDLAAISKPFSSGDSPKAVTERESKKINEMIKKVFE